MKKIIRIFLILVTLVSIIAIVYMMALFPVHKYRENTTADKSFDMKAMLEKSIPKNFSIENRKIKTTISLTEDELRSLILSEINNNGNVDGVEISIANDKIDIYVSQKVWKYFPTELNLLFNSEIKDDKAKLILNNAKLGKFNLNKQTVLNRIKDNKIMFFNVMPLDSEIILEDKELKDIITVSAIKFQDHKASVDIEVELNSIEDFKKLINIVPKE